MSQGGHYGSKDMLLSNHGRQAAPLLTVILRATDQPIDDEPGVVVNPIAWPRGGDNLSKRGMR
jgi:hypothetical protein